MPVITIDDKIVEFSGKANIMSLASQAGIEIPHFCYHPGLSVSGNCRMCMVEVGLPAREKDGSLQKDEKGQVKINFMPKLQPACYQEPADGMVIRTNSQKVTENRKHILEFLLINHPLDCPVCDQAGECLLQDYAFQYGFSSSRFSEAKRTYPYEEISDVITPESNRCIHCDRCSRFTREVAGQNVFARTGRGNRVRLATLPGEKISHNYQGNMVDLCPVGALTLTDFRFKSRVWFLKHSEGVCGSCGKGCNVVYSIDKNSKILRIKPRYNEKINSYWMCDYGRLRYAFYNDSRRDSALLSGSPAGSEVALQEAARLIRAAGKTAVIASASQTLEAQKALAAFCRDTLKTAHVDFRLHPAQIKDDRQTREGEKLMVNDPYPNSLGAREAGLVPAAGGLSAAEIVANPALADLLVVVLDENTFQNRDFLAALQKAPRLILLTPFASELDQRADVVLPILAFTEQSGTLVSVEGHRQAVLPAVPSLQVFSMENLLGQLSEKLANRA